MNPKHKKYILENINKKSTQEIAKDLRLKERKVRKFISQNKVRTKEENPLHQYLDRKFTALLIIMLILIFNLVLRYRTFFIPHFVGDQRSYIGIAMKVDKLGFRGYNLKQIGIKFSADGTTAIFYYPTKDDKGDIIKFFEEEGVFFYNQPLFHAPPLFPYLIMISHRIFSPLDEYKTISKPLQKIPGSKIFFKMQFYSSVIPVVSAILVCFFTFLFGGLLFDKTTGLIGAFLVTISPASIFASHRIWADETLTLLILLSAIFAYLTFYKGSYKFLVACGVSSALSLLVKNSALIFLLPMLYMIYFAREDDLNKRKTVFDYLFKPLPGFCTPRRAKSTFRPRRAASYGEKANALRITRRVIHKAVAVDPADPEQSGSLRPFG